MLTRLIEVSVTNRGLVIILTLLMAGGGLYSAYKLPIDAVPDMTNVQVQVVTDAGSLSPVEVERYVTYPVENTMGGLPDVEELRSVSKFGISVVTIVFQEGTDIYRARQLVTERLPDAASQIPPGYGTPSVGPLTTALGEILQFEVRSERHSPMELRTMLEWDIAPRLREVPGVTEINTHGGYYKTFEVQPDPNRMTSYGISMDAAVSTSAKQQCDLRRRLRHSSWRAAVHPRCLIAGQPRGYRSGCCPPRAGRHSRFWSATLPRSCIAPMTRQGAVTRDGRGEVVTGLVMMLIGENSREVVTAAKERLKEIEVTLPEGVRLEVTYDRAALIGRTLKTVLTNLTEGGMLVIIVLLLMLGNLRAGIIVALAIPLSMLFATNVMAFTGVTASLMSLGAIDFGLIVDSSVIMVENCIRKLSHDNGDTPPRRHYSRRGRRSSQADDVRRTDHRRRVSADSVARRHRRKTLPADGVDRAVRTRRFADPVADLHAGDGIHLSAQEDERKGCVPGSHRQVVLRTARDACDQTSGRDDREPR